MIDMAGKMEPKSYHVLSVNGWNISIKDKCYHTEKNKTQQDAPYNTHSLNMKSLTNCKENGNFWGWISTYTGPDTRIWVQIV